MDDYVECGECGCPIERHDRTGCTQAHCSCTEKWTVSEIRDVRRRNGLPGKYSRVTI